ncbi:methyl-accepting chemotaxis protein [Halomonas sp. E14]|uniref:methyl-accepting chemotaxis protein n=1 Tax=Halomonas sp. E14 TaxID=3397245 RepID=UPI00403EB0D2
MLRSKMIHLSVGRKVAVIVALPLLILLLVMVNESLNRFQVGQEARQLEMMANMAELSGQVLAETQRERGRTAVFLSTGGTSYAQELIQQRGSTDQALALMLSQLAVVNDTVDDAVFSRLAAEARERIQGLEALRGSVDGLRIATSESTRYYTQLNATLLDTIGRLAHLVNQAGVARDLNGYYALMRAQELSGIERAMLSGAFGNDTIDQQGYSQYRQLAGEIDGAISNARAFFNAEIRGLLDERLSGPEIDRVETLRQRFMQAGTGGNYGVDPTQWFDWQTVKIDRMKEVGDAVGVGITLRAEQLSHSARRSLLGYLVVMLVAVLTTGSLATFISRRIVLPLRDTADAMRDIAQGEGDLTKRIPVKSQDEIGNVAERFNEFAQRMQTTLREVRASAGSVNLASGEVARGGEDLASRTEQAAASLQQTASAMEEIAATAKHSQDLTAQARRLSVATQGTVQRGTQAMDKVEVTMEEISRSAQEIEAIISLIDSIAFQTNLLALNASVEAARAGEHGRGFAVVAQEVRTLANKSAEASQKIGSLIKQSVSQVEDGSEIVKQAGQAMREILRDVTQVATVMNEIDSGIHEQTNGIEEVNRAVAEMDAMTQHNATLVEQNRSAAAEMNRQATQLHELVGTFILGQESRDAGRLGVVLPASGEASQRRLPAAAPLALGAPGRRNADEWTEF